MSGFQNLELMGRSVLAAMPADFDLRSATVEDMRRLASGDWKKVISKPVAPVSVKLCMICFLLLLN